jgi:hypothetical protein
MTIAPGFQRTFLGQKTPKKPAKKKNKKSSKNENILRSYTRKTKK